MKRKSISFIIGLMSLAMLGVIAMQYYFLKESYVLKSQLFDQSVNDALKTVALKIERSEAAEFLAKRADSDKKQEEEQRLKEKLRLARNEDRKGLKEDPTLTFIKKLKADQAKSDSLFRVRDSLLRNRYPNILVYNGPIKVDLNDNLGNVRYDFEEIIDESGYRQVVKETYSNSYKPNKFAGKAGHVVIDSIKQYVVVDPNLGPIVKTLGKPNYLSSISPKQLAEANRKELLQKQKAREVKLYLDSLESLKNRRDIFDDIASEYQRVNIPLTKRIQKHVLDSLLILELANNGVLMNFNYTVITNNNQVIFASQRHSEENFEKNVYKTALFPRDMVRDGGILKVSFPDKKTLILSNMDTVLVSSGALLLILLGCFSFTIFSILRQKKISEMKTDFINNMTHEFKTPVATIMIASEALKDPEVNDDRERVKRLAGVIYDENVRLGDHIERVLNIAKIERDDFKLENLPVNIHDLIVGVTDSMSLQLQKNNANVDLRLDATSPLIMGDELHLTNVIYNLMDNANKYGGENPEITITTYNKGKELVLTVADKGIGMSRDQQSKIFDQFYRVPKGNVHDVKGFGLGLNYVSMMVKKMGGSVSVKSEKDIGSEFELRFVSYKYD